MAKIVTITNPLTGQPAQVDQLDHTAQQIDDGLNIARGVSNPNLLDNWYFGNPVDQRGGYVVPKGVRYWQVTSGYPEIGITESYYTVAQIDDVGNPHFYIDGVEYFVNHDLVSPAYVRGYTGAGYGIDRWKLEDSSNTGVVLINTDGSITLINPRTDDNIWFTQYAENNFDSTKRIASTLIVDKQGSALLYSGVSTGKVLSIGINSFETTATDNIAARFVVNPNSSITIKAIKLELGSQQTLAHQDENGNWVLNEIPDYGEQLARCQRYQLVLRSINTVLGDAAYVRGKYVYVSVPLPVTMRGNTNSVAVTLSGSATLYSMGGNVVLSELYPNSMAISQNIVQVIFQSSVELTSGGIVSFTDNNSKLIIDRNL